MIRPPPDDFDAGDQDAAPPDHAEASVSASTIRWRQWKERQERGEILLAIPIDHEIVAAMLDEGIVDDRGSRDRSTLVRAILTLIANALATGRSR